MKLPELKNPVVYLCSEFAIDNELPNYSGGLGVLAADIINEAAIQHYPFVGIGILYKGKEFLQHITAEGKVETRDSQFDHDTSFLRPTTVQGKPVIIEIPLKDEVEEKKILVKSYHLRLSDATILFFLSTDVEGNPSEWISDMDALYKGDSESQIRQQILLGVGGVKLLNKLGIKPHVYHLNEGRPEFIIWEIVSTKIKESEVTFEKAWEEAKNSIVYTNHTLVPAGNPVYPKSLIERYANFFAKEMGVDPQLLIKDGFVDSQNFSTTLFALNISKKQTCVSVAHASQAKSLWPNFNFIPITNGVNLLRWQDSDFRTPNLTERQIWEIHLNKKNELLKSVIQRTGFGYDPNKLVITWARRLAEYKQPLAIFKNIERLKKILKNSQRPIQLLFAGNSHTADPNAKWIIEEIIKIFSTDLNGCAIFVPNYNISLANHLTSGSDVWLNTPKGNQEACGTSGMKAASNGVINLTVLDGWTYEVDWKGKGWVLNPQNLAEDFYDILENEVAPTFYNRNQEGLPVDWIKMMKSSIELSKNFSSTRTFEEYKRLLYT